MSRRRRYGCGDADLPKFEPLKGTMIGARLMGVKRREEGVVAHGADSERWRVTDDIDALLLPDHEFVPGGSLAEIKVALESRHPSPIPGMSMIEICNDHELKRHTLPFGDAALLVRMKDEQHAQRGWGDKYVMAWKPGTIQILTDLCVQGDVLISKEIEDNIRSDDDFYHSDLVIGVMNTWYSVVKHRPGKAAGRRKAVTTVTAKDKHANELIAAARELRWAAADAYFGLSQDLSKFEVGSVLIKVSRANRNSHPSYGQEDQSSLDVVRQIDSLLVIHKALLGRHAYRYNDDWQAFLKAVRERPRDLADDNWGNYGDVRDWLAGECLIRKPKPTRKMIRDQAAAVEAEIKSRTCAKCGSVQDSDRDVFTPLYNKDRYAAGDKLCGDCWDDVPDAVDAEESTAAVAVAT